MNDLFYIWSNEHKAFWRPACCGYTDKIEEAGRYTYYQAKAILANANICGMLPPEETMIPVDCWKAASWTLEGDDRAAKVRVFERCRQMIRARIEESGGNLEHVLRDIETELEALRNDA